MTFDEIYHLYRNSVGSVCFRILRDDDATASACQDTFFCVARALHTFDGRSKLSSWIYAIAKNCALMERRRLFSRRRIVALYGPNRVTRPGNDPVLGLAIKRAITRLPTELASAIEAHVQADSMNAGAAIAGVSVPCHKTRLFRARAYFKDLLELN